MKVFAEISAVHLLRILIQQVILCLGLLMIALGAGSSSPSSRRLLSTGAIETSAHAVALNAPDIQVKGTGLPNSCPTTVHLWTGDMSQGRTTLTLNTDFTIADCGPEGFRYQPSPPPSLALGRHMYSSDP